MGIKHRASGSQLPTARLVTRGTSSLALRNLSIRKRADDLVEPIFNRLHVIWVYTTGFFPLIVPVLVMMALLWAAGMQSSP